VSARYLEQGGLATAPGPLNCTGTTMFGFWADAHGPSLRELCARLFEQPSGGQVVVRPWSSKVLIAFVRIDRIDSEPPQFARVGHVSEREVVLWIPAFVLKAPKPVPSDLLATVTACMWLDNPISITSGREVYGYPKSWGTIASDPAEAIGDGAEPLADGELPDDPATLSLDAFGVTRYGLNEVPGPRPLLRLIRGAERAPPAPGHRDDDDDPLKRLLRESAAKLGIGSRAEAAARVADSERLLTTLLGRIEVSQMFLKQFRSAAGDGLASSQEIVRAPATHIAGFSWDWLPDYELEVSHLDSHPVSTTLTPGEPDLLRLGLASQEIKTAFKARFNFRVERGETLWRAR
jgi:hypothetical protein